MTGKPAGDVMDKNLLIDQACDIYCHGLARIDTLGPNRRLVFTVPSVDSTGYQQVVVKLILPAELMVTLAYMAAGTDRDTISPDLIALETGRAN
ncbi:hypothetical protein ACVIWV_007437 [Bradyrhizobium diazoefficiens]|jgi:hypothetical protein|uniref:Uncharacterized protein n=1 Tax=Bradyrhizobium diazoefficiens TaxID=1355477 RepID=A0A0E4BQA5_9BRAD|nr:MULTISPECIES: hypothetical protein [Bradyrhizobium]MBR0868358.1 hypothetical protein [Bradyrhizobium diazoefficiens]MBR0892882.1 hypothetical protein [Bradyrhizobium diazoefficiens]MBR0924566.1 hypothetical protein [Bradyrhizobium diazoefficiens]MBR0946538.1 hypothetical protein [Bradyrhizobium liaoningense]MBR1029860.1 hypothetical protein [Bradyrhizobium liaoningense]